MSRFAAFLIVLRFATGAPAGQPQADLVDPLIGTAHEGQTFPATGVPFGMTQWTPQTRDGEAKCVAPYYAKDDRIQGFRGTHSWSGSCTQDYGSVTIFAETGPVVTKAQDRASRFRHDREHATPWFYHVHLDDSDIDSDMTGAARSGFLRFQFHTTDAVILLQPNSRAGEGEIQIDSSKREVWGVNPVHRIYAGAGKLAGFSGYFVARFDRAFSAFGVWNGTNVEHAATKAQGGVGGQLGAFLRFQVKPGDWVNVKVGTSFTSVEEARRNLDAELPRWNFDEARALAEREWRQAIGRIEVSGGSESQRRIFSTALYHAMQMPRTFSDVSGTYPGFAGDSKIHIAKGFTYYCDFSLWDTFRAVHPLLTILDPSRTRDMAQSLVVKGQQGGWIPIFPGWNSYTSEMIGDHDVAMIVDAYAKGIRGFNVEEAYRLMFKNATQTPPRAEYVDGRGRRALDSYLKFGYIPLEDPVREAFHTQEQVSRTLEYAYDDYVLAQLARALGKTGDYQALMRRAQNYRNVIDPAIGFARGRHQDGSWDSPFDPAGKYHYITEGLPWQYTFFVPQDVAGLIRLVGGPEVFTQKLDELFAKGYYDHGNEPSHHIAYLYDYAGKPWKTQEAVRRVMRTEYSTGPDGLSGNDDCGQISAWYILSALGFYPVCPGKPYYEIGTPLFDQARIHLLSGKEFTIIANGNSEKNQYIQSAALNGAPFTRSWISHREIAQGGKLVFEMGAFPNKSWASGVGDAPPGFESQQ